jgi:S-adenosylmethionine decarboxylase
MQGLHLIADLYGCKPRVALHDGAALLAACTSAAHKAQLTVVATQLHSFADAACPQAGATLVLLLAESHVSVHTWPERMSVALDVYVCNFSADNSAKAQQVLAALQDLFAPQRSEVKAVERGALRSPADSLAR